jgi:hypothetical protein
MATCLGILHNRPSGRVGYRRMLTLPTWHQGKIATVTEVESPVRDLGSQRLVGGAGEGYRASRWLHDCAPVSQPSRGRSSCQD